METSVRPRRGMGVVATSSGRSTTSGAICIATEWTSPKTVRTCGVMSATTELTASYSRMPAHLPCYRPCLDQFQRVYSGRADHASPFLLCLSRRRPLERRLHEGNDRCTRARGHGEKHCGDDADHCNQERYEDQAHCRTVKLQWMNLT